MTLTPVSSSPPTCASVAASSPERSKLELTLEEVRNAQNELAPKMKKLYGDVERLRALLTSAEAKGEGAGQLYMRHDEAKGLFVAKHGRWFSDGGFAKAKTALAALGVEVHQKKLPSEAIAGLLQGALKRSNDEFKQGSASARELAERAEQLQAPRAESARALEKARLRAEREEDLKQQQHLGIQVFYSSTLGASYINNSLRQQCGVLHGDVPPKPPSFVEIYNNLHNASFAKAASNPFTADRQEAVKAILGSDLPTLVKLLNDSLRDGVTDTFYRGTRLANAQLAQFRSAQGANAVVGFAGFASASPDRPTAEPFMDSYSSFPQHRPVMFTLEGTLYRSVSATEEEYLPKLDQGFRVVGYNDRGSHVEIALRATNRSGMQRIA